MNVYYLGNAFSVHNDGEILLHTDTSDDEKNGVRDTHLPHVLHRTMNLYTMKTVHLEEATGIYFIIFIIYSNSYSRVIITVAATIITTTVIKLIIITVTIVITIIIFLIVFAVVFLIVIIVPL